MGVNMASLLIHSADVPQTARDALRRALAAAPSERNGAFREAASLLYHSTDLECGEVKALVGLSPADCCAT